MARGLGAVFGVLAVLAFATAVGELVKAAGNHGDAPTFALVLIGCILLAFAVGLALVAREAFRRASGR